MSIVTCFYILERQFVAGQPDMEPLVQPDPVQPLMK